MNYSSIYSIYLEFFKFALFIRYIFILYIYILIIVLTKFLLIFKNIHKILNEEEFISSFLIFIQICVIY